MHRRHFEKNIPTEVIRAFITILDMGSFTKAAEHLDLTQPAISAQIKRLERILGGEVFQPGSRLSRCSHSASFTPTTRSCLSPALGLHRIFASAFPMA
jgi:hypothetical protein